MASCGHQGFVIPFGAEPCRREFSDSLNQKPVFSYLILNKLNEKLKYIRFNIRINKKYKIFSVLLLI
jgi:hypothetical protein